MTVSLLVLVSVPPVRAAIDAPVTPNAQPEVGALLRFLESISGEYVLSGQQEFPGWSDESKDTDFDYVLTTTGQRPAVRGYDFLFYVHSAAGRAGQRTTERAIAWSRAGGIVTLCCHMFMDVGSVSGSPEFYVPGASSGSKGTNFDIQQAVIAGTPENQELLAKFDLIAAELKKLRDAHVPVIWRPFHECSGGWFWWGAKGAAPFIQAWRLMFDRFTRVHGLTNLIWEYNPTDSTTKLASWYPGDDVVDIISLDVYPTAGTHPAYGTDYQRMRDFKGGRKLVAMSENGAIPDPDQLATENAKWSYFCTWNGFESNQAQNSTAFLQRTYGHARIANLEKLRELYAARAFTIVTPPAPKLVVAGAPLALSVTAHDTAALSYQWSKDGQPLAGATSATYAVGAATTAHAGKYTVAVTSANGTLTSQPATVTVANSDAGRIINLSVLGTAGTGAQTLITGFALDGGAAPKTMLLRAVGPTLKAFSVSSPLADPVLQLNTTPAVVNDDWEVNVTGSAASVRAAFDQVFAFALPAGSKDAALVVALPSGAYTASVSANGAASGTALAEIYDSAPSGGARLVNLSARANVAVGASLAPGFVIADDYRTVLVRAVAGPTLSGFGVSGVLANPRLDLYQGGTLIASNDDWAGGSVAVASLRNAFSSVNAFQIDGATRDAVLMVTLPPGQYSAQVSSADGGSGVALVEVYEVK